MNRIVPGLERMPALFRLLFVTLLILSILLAIDMALSFLLGFTLARAQPQPSQLAFEPINTISDSLSRARDVILHLLGAAAFTLIGAAATYQAPPPEDQRGSSNRNP